MAGEIILLSNTDNETVSPLYWKSGVIRKICTSPKAAETRGMMKLVDDAVNMKDQLKILMNTEVPLKVFTYLGPLLESIESLSQITEKALRQTISFLKQTL